MKKCYTCKETKPINEFHRNKNKKDGRQGSCKPCQIRYSNAWKRDNRERDNARRHQYYLENKEAENARSRRWHQEKRAKAKG
jgi:hypothetical protein